jgi:hypothetical protein
MCNLYTLLYLNDSKTLPASFAILSLSFSFSYSHILTLDKCKDTRSNMLTNKVKLKKHAYTVNLFWITCNP